MFNVKQIQLSVVIMKSKAGSVNVASVHLHLLVSKEQNTAQLPVSLLHDVFNLGLQS